MGPTFRIESPALIFCAFAILLFPLEWIAGILVATIVHELGHYIAARLLDVPVYGISYGLAGCRMGTGPMETWEEILIAAAGPAGSMLLLLFLRVFPILALCGLIQGICNLLPLYPMDGGRILKCLTGERVFRLVSRATAALLMILGIGIGLRLGKLWIILLIMWNCLVKSGYLKNSLQRSGYRGTIELPIFKR